MPVRRASSLTLPDRADCLGDERGVIAGHLDGGFEIRRDVLDTVQVVRAVLGRRVLGKLAHPSSIPLRSAGPARYHFVDSPCLRRRAPRSAVQPSARSRPGNAGGSRCAVQRLHCPPVARRQDCRRRVDRSSPRHSQWLADPSVCVATGRRSRS